MPGSAAITLSWSAVANATDYVIQRAAGRGGPFTDFATGIQATSHVNSGLDDGATSPDRAERRKKQGS